MVNLKYMFSTYGNNDRDKKCNDNNECPDIGDSTAIILTSQFLDNNNGNYSYFNPPNNVNNSIFIQPEQIDSYSSSDSSGHEHLMILAAAAVNSSPSNDSCKSSGNIGEPAIISSSESPHFSIHDPPLIRLSPTSPNNIFRHGRYSEEVAGIFHGEHANGGYTSNNVDWLSQELSVKTDNTPAELSHSNPKRHPFNNSLSDTEYPFVRSRGRNRLRQHESRDFDQSQHTSAYLRPLKDLKRKKLCDPDTDCNIINPSHHNMSTNVSDHIPTFGTSPYFNRTESDCESQIDERSNIRHRLTPELSRRHYQWWPIKRHLPDTHNDSRRSQEQSDLDIQSYSQQLNTSSNETTLPLHDVSHATSQFSPYSPPFYMFANSNSNTYSNYPTVSGNETANSEIRAQDNYTNQSPLSPETSGRHLSSSNPVEYHIGDPLPTSTNVSSYLRHILVPQWYNQRRYAVSNLPTSFRDLSRFYLPQSSARPFQYHTSSQPSPMPDPIQNFPHQTSSGNTTQSTLHYPETQVSPTDQIPCSRFSRHAQPANAPDDQYLLNNIPYRHNSIPPSMNTFLRAYGLEEVQQRQIEEPYPQIRNARIHSDAVRLHPLLRISERNFLNPILDNRAGSQFSRPFTMYESQGNVESVIQLALHLETSWSGISPDELSRLPCHYYRHERVASLNPSDKQDKCMVCLDEFIDNDQLRTLSCGHQYHVMCVDKWLKMNRTCPMCRSDAVLATSSYLFVN